MCSVAFKRPIKALMEKGGCLSFELHDLSSEGAGCACNLWMLTAMGGCGMKGGDVDVADGYDIS